MTEDTLDAIPGTSATPVVRSRRDFLRGAAVGLAVPAVASALAACKAEEAGKAAAATAPAAAAPPSATPADSDHSGGTMAPNPRDPSAARPAADEMDRHHEASIKSFP